MFGKLKDKLKSALSVFSKKTEEVAEEKIEENVESSVEEIAEPIEEPEEVIIPVKVVEKNKVEEVKVEKVKEEIKEKEVKKVTSSKVHETKKVEIPTETKETKKPEHKPSLTPTTKPEIQKHHDPRENIIDIIINAPVSTVFEFSTNPKNTHLWFDSIAREETDTKIIKIGTHYTNQDKEGNKSTYIVTKYTPEKVFEIKQVGGTYSVRYTYDSLSDHKTKLTYYEWVESGFLQSVCSVDVLRKLKSLVESQESTTPQTKTVESTPEPAQPEKKGFFSKLFSKKEEKKEEFLQPLPPKVDEVEEEVTREHKVPSKQEKPEPKQSLEPADEPGFFGKLKQAITTKTISSEKFEELFWELELVLLENNVSVEVIERIKEDLKTELVEKPLPRDVLGKINDTLRSTVRDILTYDKIDLLANAKQNKARNKPYVIAFFGINGAGKTTSIAKLTHYFQKHNLSVVLAACDTFRAGAIQQLQEHADKLGVKMIKHESGADPTAVAFDAIRHAEKNKIDVVLIDTAGRLHSNTNLMAELEKLINKNKPDLKIFVGESITGNDCVEQARSFNELVELDGAILTKADVDEKGGAPLSISYVIKKPILFLGVGQRYEDFEVFDVEKMIGRLGLE